MEWDDAQEVNTGHRHTRYPEENDVVAGLHYRGWIVAQQVGGHLRPAERTERPQPRTEPGIQHVLILVYLGAVAVRAGGYIFTADRHLAAIVTVPDRDAVPPPELARDAPVMNILQPVHVDLVEAFRHDLHLVIPDRAHSRCCQRQHLDEPLL